MKTYIIPEKNRLEGMLITDLPQPLARIIRKCEPTDHNRIIRTFILESVTDIAVYREKAPDNETAKEINI